MTTVRISPGGVPSSAFGFGDLLESSHGLWVAGMSGSTAAGVEERLGSREPSPQVRLRDKLTLRAIAAFWSVH